MAWQAWDKSLGVPLVPDGDGVFSIMLVKTLQSQLWLGVNPDLGWPFGSATYDLTLPYSDFTQLLILKLLTFIADDPPTIVNAFYLLSFPLVTASAYVVLRSLDFDRPVAATCAIVFSLLPFHFWRGEAHLFLSAYYAVPVGCWLALGVMGRVRLAERRPRSRGLKGWLTPRTLTGIGACVLVGASDAYFAVMSTVVIGALGLIRVLADRSVRPLAVAALVAAAVLGTPTLLWHQANGANGQVGERAPNESEYYGLKLANLVLPLPDHRAQPLRAISRRYYDSTALKGEEWSPALGTLMTLGLLLIVAAAAASAVGRVAPSPQERLVRDSGVAASAAFLIGTIGGGSALVAYFVSPQVRAWNRISPLIAFFAVIGLAALLSHAAKQLSNRPGMWARVASGVALVFILCFAVWDQTTTAGAPQYESARDQWRIDERFITASERILPAKAPVLQLPYVSFPETPPVHRMEAYDLLKGYLHSEDLRWSYGAMRSRVPDDWASHAAQRPVEQLVPAATAAGFKGVYVDTFGYADGGVAILVQLEKLIGAPPAVRSDDGRLVIFDLASFAARLESATTPVRRALLKQALLHPSR